MTKPAMDLGTVDYQASNWSDSPTNSLEARAALLRAWHEDGPLPIFGIDRDAAEAFPSAANFENCLMWAVYDNEPDLYLSDGTDWFKLQRGYVAVKHITVGSGTPYAISAEETGRMFSNNGTTVESHLNLPTAAVGLNYWFAVDDADGIQVNRTGSDIINVVGVVSSATNISSATIGSTLHLVCVVAGQWLGATALGTWA